jgi:hypothetical protein
MKDGIIYLVLFLVALFFYGEPTLRESIVGNLNKSCDHIGGLQ